MLLTSPLKIAHISE